jgi:rubrerythrin
MAATREEVGEAAKQLERDGRDFYLDAAEKASSPQARRMFEALADDELDHLEWIENMVPGDAPVADINRNLYMRLRPIFADVPEAKLRQVATSDSDVQAIHFAIDIEVKAKAAYAKWAEETEDEDVRTLCNTLVGVEEFHRQVLNNTLEYFEHTADWFMQEEQWNFEGA